VSQVVILLFLFPIGLYFYFFIEPKHQAVYQKTFDDFQVYIDGKNLEQHTKLMLFEEMLKKNDYVITQKTAHSIRGEKRMMSMSILAISLGVFYVGALVYLVYYFYVQKAHVVVFEIEKGVK